MSAHVSRTIGKITAAVAVAAAVASIPSTPQLAAAADSGGTIKGTVTAEPSKYLPDTVVFLKQVAGAYKARTVDMDQKGMKFIPRFLAVTSGDSVRFLNSDTVDHNVFSPDIDPYNLGMIKPGASSMHVFTKTGGYTQLCSIHPEMIAYVWVGQNPFSAVVDAQGNYSIKNVPAGTYTLSAWNPKLKTSDKSVTVKAGETTEIKVSIAR